MHHFRAMIGRWYNRMMTQTSTTRIIAIVFALIIAVGTCLLMTPAAARDGVSCGFRPALFTATSATCVTGLVLYDTWTQWSGFGQIVILVMIELGGLGFMSAASIFVFALRKKVGMKQRMIMAQAMSLNDVSGVVRLQRTVLGGSLTIQAVGAVILTARFSKDVGFWKGLRWGIFHSISAFCNAGFDILGSVAPGSSMALYATDPVVCLTIMALIVLGGLGFFVWEELVRVRKFRKLSVYSKLVLLITGTLIVAGTVAFAALEWENPATIGNMTWYEKLLASAFQSVTVRTAGFAAVDQNALTDAAKAVSLVLMFIGGSSGSTAGGVKTVTILVMVLFLATRARGRSTVTAFKRTIPNAQVLDAMTIVTVMMILAIFGGIFICANSGFSFIDAMYESVSALATVGLSSGGTANLAVASQYLIIIYMYFGRVGVLTIALGFLMGNQATERFRYAETKLLIG